jgi:hypothetical protein
MYVLTSWKLEVLITSKVLGSRAIGLTATNRTHVGGKKMRDIKQKYMCTECVGMGSWVSGSQGRTYLAMVASCKLKARFNPISCLVPGPLAFLPAPSKSWWNRRIVVVSSLFAPISEPAMEFFGNMPISCRRLRPCAWPSYLRSNLYVQYLQCVGSKTSIRKSTNYSAGTRYE